MQNEENEYEKNNDVSDPDFFDEDKSVQANVEQETKSSYDSAVIHNEIPAKNLNDSTVTLNHENDTRSDYKENGNQGNTPKVTVYSRPLLPLPKDFGFRLSEVLDLEQRVTEANFPTISTFTENFEDDIDWVKEKR